MSEQKANPFAKKGGLTVVPSSQQPTGSIRSGLVFDDMSKREVGGAGGQINVDQKSSFRHESQSMYRASHGGKGYDGYATCECVRDLLVELDWLSSVQPLFMRQKGFLLGCYVSSRFG